MITQAGPVRLTRGETHLAERPLSVLQVTSANSGDGKTTTAANLAVMLAKSNDRVLLIDADLRRPRMHEEFDIPNTKGFTSTLLGDSAVENTFHRTSLAGLLVMPSGPPLPSPTELLAAASCSAASASTAT